uniref:Uncharacterized protein n=1 Tax=Panagrolaimus sp. ES5 TaxID=591445 RepID=A0AC34FDK4_9BILA
MPSNFVKLDFEKKDEFKKAKNSNLNRSTLSLHISTYENLKEEDGDLESSKNEEDLKKENKKSNLGKKWETSNHFVDGLTPIIQNPFEFPRQQENAATKTSEVAKFKASQKLLNSNKVVPNTSFFENFIAGGVGGLGTVLVGHPFDTLKVRLQTMPKPSPGQRPLFTGALDCFKQTLKREGFVALYRGMAAPAVGVTPLFAIFFGGCAVGRWLQQKESDQELTFIQNFNAGALAGVFITVITVPGERIKCILQVQSMGNSSVKYNGPLDLVTKLYKEGGIRSIYRGTAATLIRDIPASGAYLSVYEFLKKKFAGESKERSLSPLATLAAGGFAGIANWSVCIPADVVKSRLQTAPEGKYPNGMRDVIREILQHEGPIGFFRGFAPVMLRAFPANAACFFGVELTLNLIRQIRN